MRRAVAIALLLASGCAAGPDYRRPEVAVPPGWLVPMPEAREAADADWWRRMNDPVLDGLVAEALGSSLDLRAAAARVEEARGLYLVAAAGRLPSAGIGVQAERERISRRNLPPLSAASPNVGSLFQAGVGASWEIDLWGKLRRATEAGRDELLAAEEGRRGTILSLVAAVASDYVTLRELDRELEIAQRTARSREASYRLIEARFAGGMSSELDLKQSKAELEQSLAAVPEIAQAVAQREHALCVLLGRNPGPIARGLALDDLGLPGVPEGLPSDLLERRPDLRGAERRLAAANARIGVARAAWFPTISLTGAFGGTSTALSGLFSGPARTWSLAAPVTAPLFTGGAIAGEVKAAEARRDALAAGYRQAVQEAFRDVEDALSARTGAMARFEAQSRQVEALRDAARLARLRYENGYTSYIEVLDAERGLFAAELARTRSRADLHRALVRLYESMGGGWADR